MFDWGVIMTINTLGWLKTHLLTAAHTHTQWLLTSQRIYLNQNSHKNMKNYLLWFGWYWFSPKHDVVCCNWSEHLSMRWINLKWHRKKMSTSISKKEYHINMKYMYELNAMLHFSDFSNIFRLPLWCTIFTKNETWW